MPVPMSTGDALDVGKEWEIAALCHTDGPAGESFEPWQLGANTYLKSLWEIIFFKSLAVQGSTVAREIIMRLK